MKQIITLSGFGDFEENDGMLEDITSLAKKYKLEFYPTYYDHELRGDAQAIEKITMELWSMPRDQWADNALFETVLPDNN